MFVDYGNDDFSIIVVSLQSRRMIIIMVHHRNEDDDEGTERMESDFDAFMNDCTRL